MAKSTEKILQDASNLAKRKYIITKGALYAFFDRVNNMDMMETNHNEDVKTKQDLADILVQGIQGDPNKLVEYGLELAQVRLLTFWFVRFLGWGDLDSCIPFPPAPTFSTLWGHFTTADRSADDALACCHSRSC